MDCSNHWRIRASSAMSGCWLTKQSRKQQQYNIELPLWARRDPCRAVQYGWWNVRSSYGNMRPYGVQGMVLE
ncbi:hypothetical protein AMATHDRAFT_66690 [Amanita thiersii Skay4041]|uniref:Uncharacterized protein n=1 Tax=Amanita thiersii Skay4041 TaxID=703135 RepID=A0A2A9NCL5_9AGAR|nr:hypothetical protein AMATHDRAFT_66690 [Amanita thiersii Skay4041]